MFACVPLCRMTMVDSVHSGLHPSTHSVAHLVGLPGGGGGGVSQAWRLAECPKGDNRMWSRGRNVWLTSADFC